MSVEEGRANVSAGSQGNMEFNLLRVLSVVSRDPSEISKLYSMTNQIKRTFTLIGVRQSYRGYSQLGALTFGETNVFYPDRSE